MSDDNKLGTCPYCGVKVNHYDDYCEVCGEEFEPLDLEDYFEYWETFVDDGDNEGDDYFLGLADLVD